jgi:hypothetical protein
VATDFDGITEEQAGLIREAKLFFIASTDPDLGRGPQDQGPVNLSPKGGVPLHIIDDRHLAYLDYMGSGNETARHTAAGGPVTVMVMSLDGEDAAIVRLYGHAKATPFEQSPLADLVRSAPSEDIELAERQVVEIEVEHSTTSCGYGVPVYEYVGERTRAERGRRYKG